MAAQTSKPVSKLLSRYPWLLLLVILTATLLVWAVLVYRITPMEYQQAALTSDNWLANVLEPWNHWDTPYYLSIAENWYTPDSAELSFPPVYSILVGLLGRILGGQFLLASLLLSWISLALACGLLYQEFQVYTDQDTSLRAVRYMLIFPTAFFLFAGYTESLFLVLLLLSWSGARKGVWWQAGLFGLLAMMTRFVGLNLLLPYAWLWLKAPNKDKIRIAAWLSPMPVVFFGWQWLTKALYDLGPVESGLRFWYVKTGWPWQGLFGSIRHIIENPGIFGNYHYVDVAAVFLFSWAVIWALRRKLWPEAIFMTVMMGTFLIKILEMDMLISTSRYVLVLFPGFVMLAEWGKKKWFNILWSVISLLYMFHLSLFFFIGK